MLVFTCLYEVFGATPEQSWNVSSLTVLIFGTWDEKDGNFVPPVKKTGYTIGKERTIFIIHGIALEVNHHSAEWREFAKTKSFFAPIL